MQVPYPLVVLHHTATTHLATKLIAVHDIGHTFKTSITTHRSTLFCSRPASYCNNTATTQTNTSTHSWSSVPEFRAHHPFFRCLYLLCESQRLVRARGARRRFECVSVAFVFKAFLAALLGCAQVCLHLPYNITKIQTNHFKMSLSPHKNEYVYISFCY